MGLDCLSFLKPKELVLVSRQMQPIDLDSIIACSTIEKLAFYQCGMTDKSIVRFATSIPTRLKVLTLANDPADSEKHCFSDKS